MSSVTRRTIATALPAAAAITVFGVIFGALFRPLAGVPLTILMSVLVFSGALQFTVATLLLAGAGPAGILLAAVTLNVRHLLLGAVLRPKLTGGRTRRALSSWFMVDEAAGFALAEKEDPDHALLVAGLLCYASWQIGTILGVLGARTAGLEEAAGAVFPVLFVGLAALAVAARDHVPRAVAAAVLTIGIALLWPDVRGLAPALAAVAVAFPGRAS